MPSPRKKPRRVSNEGKRNGKARKIKPRSLSSDIAARKNRPWNNGKVKVVLCISSSCPVAAHNKLLLKSLWLVRLLEDLSVHPSLPVSPNSGPAHRNILGTLGLLSAPSTPKGGIEQQYDNDKADTNKVIL
uniref:Uncharacterized protein n=1 Tax=Solanum lycopersicum TaxID=4081 RepID=A0A3Q7IG89_SOLLC